MNDCSLAEIVVSGLHGHSSAAPSLTLPLGFHLYGDRDSGHHVLFRPGWLH